MESIHFGITSGKRGNAVPHIGYITRRGRHAARSDLIGTGYGNMPDFAKDNPDLLWRASDKYERRNGSTFRAFTISLPNVLSIEQNNALAWELAKAIAGEKPFHLGVHLGLSSLRSEPHPHAHIAICDRLPDGIERTAKQMFKRYNPTHPEKGGCRKDSGGTTRQALHAHVTAQRKAAADEINAALAKHGHDRRVDHRTLRERGINRAPERYLGPARIRKMTTQERAAYVEKQRAEH